MMTQRNVEIQLQALDLIEHRQSGMAADEGHVSKSDAPDLVLSNSVPQETMGGDGYVADKVGCLSNI